MVKKLNRKAIKQMEQAIREDMRKKARLQPEEQQIRVSFNEWHIMREPLIPAQHNKEILRADFIGQGLKGKATMQDFDRALARYGVKLN